MKFQSTLIPKVILEEIKMATDAHKRANAKYDSSHTKQIKLQLNLKTDKDVLDRLDQVENKQGYIKGLIRSDINMVKLLESWSSELSSE